ncbi:neo-calmodulin-like isoform X3 [Mya arenaria]|uniref:neo-calmodulin-like isoform X3 n=1 Tax=Mya arenaria TaxID=6604 RepID=UPI0022E1FC6C|nr:neo-calmodulin-like isoform X3 [Mya arenaria]
MCNKLEMECCGCTRGLNGKSSNFKKFIRSPRSKNKHSKSRNSKDSDVTSPGGSGQVTSSSASNGMANAKTCANEGNHDQRVPNGLNDKDSDLLHVFQMFDKNKDGKISSEELGCVLRTLGHEHSQKEVEDMIKNADTNENGYVEFDEFLTMMHRHKDSESGELDPNSAEAKKLEAFRVFDMDGNGFIDKHELKCVMRRLGETLSDDDLKAMFSEADLNGDGLIDFEEFSRLNMA